MGGGWTGSLGFAGVIGRFSARGLTRAAPIAVVPADVCTDSDEIKRVLTVSK